MLKTLGKTISWRMVGAADTFLLSFLITGNMTMAAGVCGFEVITKSFLYFAHERGWEYLSR